MTYSKYPYSRYVSGTYKATCPRCGFDYLRSEMKKEWDGAIVCSKCFDPKHPQEDKQKYFRKPTQLKVDTPRVAEVDV